VLICCKTTVYRDIAGSSQARIKPFGTFMRSARGGRCGRIL
jgi:hypothetical protein